MHQTTQIQADKQQYDQVKRERLAQLLKKKAKKLRAFPLSFAQERLWVLWQLDPESAVYNIPAAIHFKRPLDVNLFSQALNFVIQRHEILRTTFSMVDGRGVQIILPSLAIIIPVVDLTHLSTLEQQKEVRRLANQEASRAFDLTKGPLLRAKVLQLGNDGGSVLALNLHHIIADGWSINIFIREVSLIYSKLANQESLLLPELPIQYADFSVWQQTNQDLLNPQLEYWTQRLEGIPSCLELPTDYRKPKRSISCGATNYFSLSPSLTKGLENFCSVQRTTLFILLLAVFKLLLHRYSKQTDIVIGTPVANRNRLEIEDLIGFFVNTIVLRSRFNQQLTFRQLLKQVSESALEAFDHQDLPFEKLVKAMLPDRDEMHTPIFQVLFSFFDDFIPDDQAFDFDLLELDNGTTKFDLTLSLSRSPKGIQGFFQYRTDLYHEDTIKQMLLHYQMLLEAVIDRPDSRILDYSLLTQTDLQRLHKESEKAKTAYKVDLPLHKVFERRVEQSPNAIALTYEGDSVSYSQLNRRANRLAHYLHSVGVGADSLVGLCMERSIDMLVALLGILKAGGAYVPLDPVYPQSRLAHMVMDSKISLLLTQHRLLDQLSELPVDVIYLDSDWDNLISMHVEDNLECKVNVNNQAYVIYTSGSTGRPKGVSISHANVLRLFAATESKFSFDQDDVWTLFHSYAFDFSVWEIWGALLNGGRLVIVPYMISRSPAQFYRLLAEQRVTVLNQTPSAFRQLINEDQQCNEALSLRWIIFGGEALDIQSLKPWFDRHGDSNPTLVNMYGITETTVHVSFRIIQLADLDRSGSSVIGESISDLQIYLLDQLMQPVSQGLSGEIYVGGAGLARGYINHPDLTAERFVPNPFVVNNTGDRLYRTGDIARYLRNGDLEYIGRIDNQVKIRGFRIELGEIEASLNQHQSVDQAVVTVQTKQSGNKHLIAYFVAKQEDRPSVDELRHKLANELPEYMVPAVFVPLDRIPITANGKVDYDQLSLANISETSKTPKPIVEPRDNYEKTLSSIWCEVLERNEVSVQDNFFEIGGDSILAIQIISKANQAGLKLNPKQLFQNPTIAKLATVVENAPNKNSKQSPITGMVPLIPIQHWFFQQEIIYPHHWNQATLIELQQPLDIRLLETIVLGLITHHDVLRLRFKESMTDQRLFSKATMKKKVKWQQTIVAPGDSAPVILIDLSKQNNEQQDYEMQAVSAKYQESLNLQEGPLMRVILFELGPNRNRQLLFIVHHLLIDGVSWRILLEDFQNSYHQLIARKAIQLPAKTSSYKTWAEHLLRFSDSPEYKKETQYWLNEAKFNSPRLPVDFQPLLSSNTLESANTVSRVLSFELTQTLIKEIPAVYHTQINDALLAALIMGYSAWSGYSSLTVELEGHGREALFDDVDLSRTVGWFTSIFPINLEIDNKMEPGEILKSVKEKIRRIPNKGIGYGLLRYLSEDENITRTLCNFTAGDISFNYLGRFDYKASQQDIFARVEGGYGPARSPQGQRPHLLSINSYIADGCLRLDWEYSHFFHRTSSIEKFADAYLMALSEIIRHCQSTNEGEFTPSDFPLAQLDDDQFKRLSQLLVKKN